MSEKKRVVTLKPTMCNNYKVLSTKNTLEYEVGDTLEKDDIEVIINSTGIE